MSSANAMSRLQKRQAYTVGVVGRLGRVIQGRVRAMRSTGQYYSRACGGGSTHFIKDYPNAICTEQTEPGQSVILHHMLRLNHAPGHDPDTQYN